MGFCQPKGGCFLKKPNYKSIHNKYKWLPQWSELLSVCLTLVLYVAGHGFGIHDHWWDGSAELVGSRFHSFSELRVLRVLHLSFCHQQDPIGSSGDAGCPGDQHLRLVIGHCYLTLVQVFLNGVFWCIQQRPGVDRFIHQTWGRETVRTCSRSLNYCRSFLKIINNSKNCPFVNFVISTYL